MNWHNVIQDSNTEQLIVDSGQLTVNSEQWAVSGAVSCQLSTVHYSMPGMISRQIPPSLDWGQAYYWSYRWQLGEQESRTELGAGQAKTFATAADGIRWLSMFSSQTL